MAENPELETVVSALGSLCAAPAALVQSAASAISPEIRMALIDALAISPPTDRRATVSRQTKETSITASVYLDGTGQSDISSGLGFFDHMLTALSKHSLIDIKLRCSGDLQVDDHHTVEDCALAIGQALDTALGNRVGICRYGSSFAPLDESLARCVLDLSGRPHSNVDLQLKRDMIGQVSCEMLKHALESLATAARMTLHVDVLKGSNDHHRAESAFKAVALALRQAVAIDVKRPREIASTKGSL
jgi:imidazoleglycerol-phosphate dehydratase